jgi:hypothetical protein
LHADYEPQDDGTELIEHPDPRQQMIGDHRTYRDGEPDRCAEL